MTNETQADLRVVSAATKPCDACEGTGHEPNGRGGERACRFCWSTGTQDAEDEE